MDETNTPAVTKKNIKEVPSRFKGKSCGLGNIKQSVVPAYNVTKILDRPFGAYLFLWLNIITLKSFILI